MYYKFIEFLPHITAIDFDYLLLYTYSNSLRSINGFYVWMCKNVWIRFLTVMWELTYFILSKVISGHLKNLAGTYNVNLQNWSQQLFDKYCFLFRNNICSHPLRSFLLFVRVIENWKATNFVGFQMKFLIKNRKFPWDQITKSISITYSSVPLASVWCYSDTWLKFWIFYQNFVPFFLVLH